MSTRLRTSVFAATSIAALVLAGCGGGDTGQGTGGGGPNEPPPDATYDAGPFDVGAGEELVMCTYVRGTNDHDEDVVAFATEQAEGGHHLIVYTLDHEVDLPPTACSQGGQPGWNQILVTQIHTEQQTFPAGVGFHVKAHQQYVMETHYINTTSHALKAASSFSTTYATPGAVTQRAATYFFGTMNIDVPANGTAHGQADCQAPFDMQVHTMFGHEHRTGTGVAVEVEQKGDMKKVYETKQWDNPPITSFSPELELAKGDHVHVACDWQNASPDELRYPHEMCFAIGYYWPAEASAVCIAGGGDDSNCRCMFPGSSDTGPGGSRVVIDLNRKDEIANVKGDVDAGWPMYCALYHADDWAGLTPKAGAQPAYFRDQVDVKLASSKDVATFTIEDVTPGDYKASCMMDTIGGGFVPGSGDALTLVAADIHAVKGQTAKVKATLDFALP